MAKKQEEAPARTTPPDDASVNGPGSAGGGVDRIREILFGRQMEDYESRFVGLENSLKDAAATLRGEISEGLSAVQQDLSGKSSNLNSQLAETERALREDGIKLSEQQQQDSARLAESLEQVRTTLDTKIEAVATRFEEAIAALSSQMQSQNSELLKTLDTRLGELSSVKADRATLATLLTDLAGNLTSDAASLKKD